MKRILVLLGVLLMFAPLAEAGSREDRRQRKLERKHISTMNTLYDLMKKISRQEIKAMKGADVDKLYADADAFVKKMKTLIETHHH